MGNCWSFLFFLKSTEIDNYGELKRKCLAKGVLFEDSKFPPKLVSIYRKSVPEGIKGQEKKIKWLRPSEIVSSPKFLYDGASRFDVKQGALGNCWILGAMANLAMKTQLFYQVVPGSNTFEAGDYCGIFRFRFWQYGLWVDVVVDDCLPTIDGKLIFAKSEEKCEFWSALFEKAYAKLHGTYEAIETGPSAESLEDFTGGIVVKFELKYFRDDPLDKSKLFADIKFSIDHGSIANCSTDDLVDRSESGILRGHAYSVTAARLLKLNGEKIRLLRIRNPWGNKTEWTGAWSDGAPEWKSIPDSIKENMNLIFSPDGEFWISFEDFKQQFDRIDICYVRPDVSECVWEEDEVQMSNQRNLATKLINGTWHSTNKVGRTPEALSRNPKYLIELTKPDENNSKQMCTMIAAIMQKNRRVKIKNEKTSALRLHIFKVPLDESKNLAHKLDIEFFKSNEEVSKQEAVNQGREHILHCRLPLGTYCLVPSAQKIEGEFLLRIFTETDIKVLT